MEELLVVVARTEWWWAGLEVTQKSNEWEAEYMGGKSKEDGVSMGGIEKVDTVAGVETFYGKHEVLIG